MSAGGPGPGEWHDVLVVGAGNAGISLAARLRRKGARDVAVLDRRRVHRYRPLLNYVASGEATTSDLERPQHEVVPPGVRWIAEDVGSVDPVSRTVTTTAGRTLGYGTLVLCPGLEEDWEAVPGLRQAYEAGWAGSSFVDTSAPRVWPTLRELSGGTVVFTVPPEPAPCGATALKPLLMACDHWRRGGVLGDLDVRLVTPYDGVLDLPQADDVLTDTLTSYGVRVVHGARVTSAEADARALTVTGPAGEERIADVVHAHVVPPYRGAGWIADAGLATGDAGQVDVDPETFRHREHPEVWALGDVAALGTRPSGGALRKQVAVLADNLTAARHDPEQGLERYDGYTVMPITTARHRLLLVEVDRHGDAVPSVPVLDLARPRLSTWAFDRFGLLQTYYRRILRGRV